MCTPVVGSASAHSPTAVLGEHSDSSSSQPRGEIGSGDDHAAEQAEKNNLSLCAGAPCSQVLSGMSNDKDNLLALFEAVLNERADEEQIRRLDTLLAEDPEVVELYVLY